MNKLCELIALLTEKYVQLCEVENQQEVLCEKIDDIVGDEDSECPECPEPVTHTFQVFMFDEANGIFDADYIHDTTVNGTTLANPFSAAWVNKSEAYETTTDAINALPGVTLTLVNDVPLNENGKPEYLLTFEEGVTLTFVNNHTGDVYSFGTNEDGTCFGTIVDSGGDAISSYTPVEQ
jgi:hypothetical protein